uniref:glutathione-disulfide reductase n=1 Tax=Dunaliella tertiolecta TaxID=3047 RepID=A0A7S3VL37_DUNTE|nr:glutathione reductase 1 [Dunaliella salina]|mmetsp:Transcript_5360/g.14419  ORF Transcript_5360/g.14419 Transcript_5360/m.14419 type:complete len:558 (+) Transcript_5360:1357-3030(+)
MIAPTSYRAQSLVSRESSASMQKMGMCKQGLRGLRTCLSSSPTMGLGLGGRRGQCLWAPSREQMGIRGLVSSVAAAASGDDAGQQFDYDLFTIGAGSGGVRGSRIASSYGAKVAVCELPFDFKSSDRLGGVGGTCVLRGCVPKKLMVYASEFADHFNDSRGFGWSPAESIQHDWTHMLEAKRKELTRLNNAYKNTLGNAKVDLIEGRGKVVDAHTVDVDGKRYTAKHIMIAVGGRATKLGIPGAEHTITSDDALELSRRPDKITVIGGGYIAVEFAGIFHRFGSDVHLVFRQPMPLRGFDEEVRKFTTDQYAASGLQMHPYMTPAEVKKQPDGKLTVVMTAKDGSKVEIADNDHVLMATGRAPNTENLGLEEAGVQLGPKGQVIVDEYCRSSVPSIWAVGDVIDRIQLTPVALMEGMALARTIALNEPTKPDYEAVPSAVFSHPELAGVGLTEEQAVQAHPNLDIYTSSFRAMRNTLSGSPLRCFMKMIVDADTRVVLGAHMVGDHAAEIMQGFAVAVKMKCTKEQIDSVVGIHPSSAEEFVTMRSVSRKIRGGQPA